MTTYSNDTIAESHETTRKIINNFLSAFAKENELPYMPDIHLIGTVNDQIVYQDTIRDVALKSYSLATEMVGEAKKNILAIDTEGGNIILTDEGKILHQSLSLNQNDVVDICLVTNPNRKIDFFTDNVGTFLASSTELGESCKTISFFSSKEDKTKQLLKASSSPSLKMNDEGVGVRFVVDESGEFKGVFSTDNIIEATKTEPHIRNNVSPNVIFFDAAYLATQRLNEAKVKSQNLRDFDAYKEVLTSLGNKINKVESMNKEITGGLQQLAMTMTYAIDGLNRTGNKIKMKLTPDNATDSVDNEQRVDSNNPSRDDVSAIVERQHENSKKEKTQSKNIKR